MIKRRQFLRIAGLLAGILLLTSFPVPFYAEEEAVPAEETAEPGFVDLEIRVGLKYSSTALDKFTTSSDTGGTFGPIQSGVYMPAVSFASEDVVTAKPDSGYHLGLTDALSDWEAAENAMSEIRTLLAETEDTTPFYLYDGSTWQIAVSFYQEYPEPGVADVNGLEKWTRVSGALAETDYAISVIEAKQNAVKTYVNGMPVLVLNTADTETKIRFVPETVEGLSLPPLLRLDRARYRGKLEICRVKGGNLVVVNELPVEEYLYAVVPSEMIAGTPSTYDKRREGLKAQAILARTLAYYCIVNKKINTNGFHVDDTTNTQVYSGYTRAKDGAAGETENTTNAVNETTGLILYYGSKIVSTLLYASNNAGYMESAENVWGGSGPAYIVSKPDPWNPPLLQTVSYTGGSLTDKLVSYIKNNKSTDVGTVEYINIVSRSQSGRVTELFIEGSANDAVITKQSTRTALGLRSQMFHFEVGDTITIVKQADGSDKALSDRARKYLEGAAFTTQFVADSYAVRAKSGYLYERIRLYGSLDPQAIRIQVEGYGHGCGMSQDGAEAMSKAGKTCFEIIEFYLPGVTVSPLIAD